MKIYLLLMMLTLSSLYAHAQQKNDWDAFSQKIDVTAYRGMLFKFQAAVKVNAGKHEGEAELWARVDKQNGKPGFFDNMEKRPILINEWKVYTVKGNIDDSAKSLSVGGMYARNGIYSFDDFQLEIQQENNQWKKIDLANAGFETDSLNKWKFFYNRKGFTKMISQAGAFERNNYLQVTGTGMEKATPYGNDDEAGKYVTANGIKIYYEAYGSGEPLLLLHGNGQSIDAFNQQIPEFAKKYHVIAVDTRGHGKTQDKADKFTYDLFAEDMNALLDKLHIDSANIVGWSDGGNTGLIMAMKYPKKVKKLVTMGAVVFADSTVVSQDLINELKFGIEEMKNAKTPEEKNEWKKAVLLLDEPKHKFTDLLEIKCPVLVMAGEKDIVKLNHTKGIAASIPKGKLYIAPNETHYFPQENAAAFNKVVLDFLQN